MKDKKTIKRILAELATLTVIVAVLQLVGNSITVGEVSISLIMIPVVVGAVLCGPIGGAWLGAVFGLVVILSGQSAVFYDLSPFSTIISCVGRGALTGAASGLVFYSLKKSKTDLAIILASITAPLTNTLLFIVCCLGFFHDFFAGIFGSGYVFKGLIKSYVSINFLLELSMNMVFAPMLVRLTLRLEKREPKLKNGRSKDSKRLATRLIIAVILLGVLICTVSTNSGYKNYSNNMEKQYNDTAYQIAETAATYLDKELLSESRAELGMLLRGEKSREDISYVTESEEYKAMTEKLISLCSTMGANDISVWVKDMDVATMRDSRSATYIICSASAAEGESLFGCSFDLTAEQTSALAASIETKQRPDSYLISEKEGLESTIAIVNVYGDADELLATVSVEVPMSALRSSIRSELTNSAIMLISIEIIFITLYFYYISYRVIDPIKVISDEVSGFMENRSSNRSSEMRINTNDEIQQLAEDIVKMEKDIDSYITNITAITAEKERIGAELNVAARIQTDMLPSKFPAFPERKDFDIYASMTPAKEVGGDFYDFFMLDDDHIALVIADVSGKGVPAALFMVIAKTLIKNQTFFNRSPKEVLEAVNNQLRENNSSNMFVTAWVCILELSTGRCVSASAGHEYPAIRRANGDFELIKDRHGFVLAGMKNSRYHEFEFELEKGGTLFVYTDGVTEATNADKKLFGTERMIETLNTDRSASPAELIGNIKREIDSFVGDAPQFDDITMLCVKRT